MVSWRRLAAKIYALLAPKRVEEDLAREIASHLTLLADDFARDGMPPEEARLAARRAYGGVEQAKQAHRDERSVLWIEQTIQDVRFGLRTLSRSPSVTIAAILAIALGVGINVGVFSVINGLALRLLPVPHASEILTVHQLLHFYGQGNRDIRNNPSYVSWSEYLSYRNQNHVFSGLAAYEPEVQATLAGGNPDQIPGTLASCNYFDVLEEHPAVGRGFVDTDCSTTEGDAVAVLSEALWRTRFGANPAIIGQPIILNRTPYTVIGIARSGFSGTEAFPSEFWVPLTMQKVLEPGENLLAKENLSWLAMIGRTRPGFTIDTVRADLNVIAQRINYRFPHRGVSLVIHTARFFSSPEERQVVLPVSSVILAAFALVLLIACTNVTSLLLARASVRQKEMALRLSLGAGRRRLIRQLLTESLLLSLAGGTLGSVIACYLFGPLVLFVTSHLPSDLPPVAINVAPDLHVLLYALLLTFVTAILFGLIPALESTHTGLSDSMKGDGTYSTSRMGNGRALLKGLVGFQSGICMILLLAAGLLLRGVYYAQTVDPGFEMRGVAASFLDLRHQGYDPPHATQFMRQFTEKIHGDPGVTAVAQAENAPLAHDISGGRFMLPGRADWIPIEYNHVTPGYFSLLGISITRGRDFAPPETGIDPSIIVTESTAQHLWPRQDPIGKTLLDSERHEHIVIGVVRDAQVSRLGESASNYVYYPFGPEDNERNYVLVRHGASFGDTASSMMVAAHSIDRGLNIKVTRLEDYLELWRAPSRILACLAGSLGMLALVLCSIGVYGMVSFSVSRSVREIGIRLALGADKGTVVRHMFWQALKPVLIGGAVGVTLSALVSNLLVSVLFGIGAHDPAAFVIVPGFLFAVASLAAVLPASRATRVDPAVTLRCE